MLEDKDVAATPICIYKVPYILRVIKPEAYTPHYIGLGPYHHWREDLYVLDPYKLLALKNSLKDCHDEQETTQRLTHLANRLKDEEIARIHACYDKNLDDMDEETLAWMMVVDAIFLLQFFQVFMPPKRSCLSSSERTACLVDPYESAYHGILQDIMKLENQIPIFVFQHVLPPCEISNEQYILPNMLRETCMKLSPFKLDLKNLRQGITEYAHLLELLYYFIVPEESNNSSSHEYCHDVKGNPSENNTREQNKCFSNINIPPPDFSTARTALNNIRCSQVFMESRPMRAIGNMTRLVPAVTPFIKSLFGDGEKLTDPESGGSSSSSEVNDKEAPKVEEIEIPSVSELLRVGIEFCPMNDRINSIKFDKKTRKFFLPSITINANTEVIIRNLVAYEAVGVSGPSFLGRYTELMNRIIDTAEDVRLLRDRHIIVNYLKSDDDVAQLWNGMSRSIRLSRIHSMDKAIKEVNKYFDSHMRVKFIRFTKGCMLCGWKISMLLLTLVVVVLMAIQSFCEVYTCPRALGPATKPGS